MKNKKTSNTKSQENITSRNFVKSQQNIDNHRRSNDSVVESASSNNAMITRRVDTSEDYEYIDTDDESEPEYYYYYYYDYMDSGIDISHELTTYEPLPSPLPLASESGHNETESTTSKHRGSNGEN